MPHLGHGRVSIKFNYFLFVQQISSSLYSNFILCLCIAYELNNWACNPGDNFTLKKDLFGAVKLKRNAI